MIGLSDFYRIPLVAITIFKSVRDKKPLTVLLISPVNYVIKSVKILQKPRDYQFCFIENDYIYKPNLIKLQSFY